MNHALQAIRCAPRRLSPADRRAHLVGIADVGMQALAELLTAEGWLVTGSDAAEPPHWLWSMGVRTFRGYAAGNVDSAADLLIYNDAIEPHHVERRQAAERGIRQFSQAQMLGELMTGRVGLAVAGTHGKSATTAIAASILSAAGLDPTVASSGTPLAANSGARPGRGRHFLAEACEDRHGFLHLAPRVAVILGVDGAGVGGVEAANALESAFGQFARRLPANGVLVVNGDCPTARRVAQTARCRVVTFGLEPRSDWQAQWLHADSGRYCFEIAVGGNVLGEFALRVPGRYQVVYALAAACLAGQVGADTEAIRVGIRRFTGLKRGLERVGFWQGAVWFDDDARHPAEIRSALGAVREMFPNRRIWCIFQPQQVSATRRLLDELAGSLRNADRLAIAEVIEARETPPAETRVAAADLAERARALGAEVICEHRLEDIFEAVRSAVRGGDILLTLGAGDIRNVWNASTGRLRSYRAAG